MIKFFYITNDPAVARIAEKAGVDRVFVDLETIGKAQRQGGMDTVQSHHSLEDVKVIKEVLTTSELLVRSNPIHAGSKVEIETIITNGADYVMLPYFKTTEEVATFIDLVDGRAKTIPLVETKEAVDHIDEILDLNGIDEIYIGLNDLHLSYRMKFMFQLLADGTVDALAEKINARNIPFGFGGIARIDCGAIPGEEIIKEHYRIGSTLAILSRSFCNVNKMNDLNDIESLFVKGFREIRKLENQLESKVDIPMLEKNHQKVIQAVKKIISR